MVDMETEELIRKEYNNEINLFCFAGEAVLICVGHN